MICGFLPGGRATISRPASSGSSDSVSCSSASPPPKRWVNSRWKWALTVSKAASSRSRPSRLRLPIPWRRRWMAATRSSRSVTSASRRAAISFASASARRLTAAEPLALLPVALEPGLDVDEVGERRVRLELGDRSRPPPAGSRAPRRSAATNSASRSPRGDDALLGAAALLARLGESCSSAARAARSASASAASPIGERVARGRRAPPRPWRSRRGARGASPRSAPAPRRAGSARPRPRRGARSASRSAPRHCRRARASFWRSTAIAGQPAGAKLGLARRGSRPRRAPRQARRGRRPTRSRGAASSSAKLSGCGRRGERRRGGVARRGRLRRALRRGGHSPRRGRSAARRGAPTSRSAAASASRAASKRPLRLPPTLARRRARPPRRRGRRRRGFERRGASRRTRRARSSASAVELGEAVAVGEPLRGRAWAIRRWRRSRPSARGRPRGVTSRWPGRRHGCSRAPVLAVATMPDLGEAAGEHRRRLDMGRQRLDAVGQRRIVGERIDAAPMRRRGGVDRRVEIVAEGGAERRLEAGVDLDLIEERRPRLRRGRRRGWRPAPRPRPRSGRAHARPR